MKNYFLFDEEINPLLLSGLPYGELSSKISENRRRIYKKRIDLWKSFCSFSKENKRPLIILLGGHSNAGKSSWALEIAHRFGIRNIVHTDTIRNVLRRFTPKNKCSILHYSSYEAWKATGNEYSDKLLIKGIKEQAGLIMPYINSVIEEAVDYGKHTIIEGMHIIPSVVKKKDVLLSRCLMFFLNVGSPILRQRRMLSRFKSTYLGRECTKYLSHFTAFDVIGDYCQFEAKKMLIPVIDNADSTTTLDNIMELIYSHLSDVMRHR